MKVIFNRSLKVGGVIHPKSKVAVELDDKLKDDWFVKHHMAEGGISLVVEAAPAGKPAQPAKAAK